MTVWREGAANHSSFCGRNAATIIFAGYARWRGNVREKSCTSPYSTARRISSSFPGKCGIGNSHDMPFPCACGIFCASIHLRSWAICTDTAFRTWPNGGAGAKCHYWSCWPSSKTCNRATGTGIAGRPTRIWRWDMRFEDMMPSSPQCFSDSINRICLTQRCIGVETF